VEFVKEERHAIRKFACIAKDNGWLVRLWKLLQPRLGPDMVAPHPCKPRGIQLRINVVADGWCPSRPVEVTDDTRIGKWSAKVIQRLGKWNRNMTFRPNGKWSSPGSPQWESAHRSTLQSPPGPLGAPGYFFITSCIRWVHY
jgi:hypothetical protein